MAKGEKKKTYTKSEEKKQSLQPNADMTQTL